MLSNYMSLIIFLAAISLALFGLLALVLRYVRKRNHIDDRMNVSGIYSFECDNCGPVESNYPPTLIMDANGVKMLCKNCMDKIRSECLARVVIDRNPSMKSN